jgi:DNA invertase Pin-like site-specific DNA recombinase
MIRRRRRQSSPSGAYKPTRTAARPPRQFFGTVGGLISSSPSSIAWSARRFRLWEIVKRLEAVEDGGAGLRVLNLGGETVDTKSATGKLILAIFAGFAQFQLEMMLERQREGIAKAKGEGRYLGRRPSARLKADEVRKLRADGKSPTQIAATLGIGRGSVYRALETTPSVKES